MGAGNTMTSETDDVEELFEGEDEETEEKSEDNSEKSEEETDTKGEPEAEEKAEEPAPPAEKEETLVPIAAIHDERRKTAQARQELEDLRKLLPETDEAPDPYDDIEAYDKYKRDQWDKEQKTAQNKVTEERLDKSRSKMLETEGDYEAMERLFGIMLADDPSLRDKMLASGDEGKFVYDTAKKYREEQLNPKTKKEPEKVEQSSERSSTSEIDGANLATATAQDSNTPKVEKEESLDEMFEDQDY